jgi:hypothetical protein
MLTLPKTTVPVAIKYLKSFLPRVDEILQHMESSGGWLGLPSGIGAYIEFFQIRNYVELYQDETRLPFFFWRMARDWGKIKARTDKVGVPTQESVNKAFDWLVGEVADFVVPELVKGDKSDETDFWEHLATKEGAKEWRQMRDIAQFGIAVFYNILSIMVHGERLTALVERAISGDDEAFVLAVQVDRNILTGIPYFRERLSRAQWSGERQFLRLLGYRLGNSILRGKIRYRRLWLALALLDLLGHLDRSLTAEKLLEILDAVGVDKHENRIEDVGYLRKRIREYRRFQERNRKRVP